MTRNILMTDVSRCVFSAIVSMRVAWDWEHSDGIPKHPNWVLEHLIYSAMVSN